MFWRCIVTGAYWPIVASSQLAIITESKQLLNRNYYGNDSEIRIVDRYERIHCLTKSIRSHNDTESYRRIVASSQLAIITLTKLQHESLLNTNI